MGQDVDVNFAVRLRGYGYDVVTTRDVGNLGNPDEKQLEYAANNGRAIVTHNRRDFRRLHRDWIRRAQHHCGVIVSVHINLEELERRILNLLRSVSAEQARNMLFSLSDFR